VVKDVKRKADGRARRADVLVLVAAGLGERLRAPMREDVVALGSGCEDPGGAFPQQSVLDEVSGPDLGLQFGASRRHHFVEGCADGVGIVGEELMPHRVHAMVNRCSQMICVFKRDQPQNVIDLIVKLGNIVVPAEQLERLLDVLDDKVEPVMRNHSGIGGLSRNAR
jgi:hypothetical protein